MINELFLWSANDTPYLLTHNKKTKLTQIAHCKNIDLNESYPASQLLAKELLEYLENNLNQPDTTTRLYLHHSLDSIWQHLDWEKLSLNGKTLDTRLQIIRYADFGSPVTRNKEQKWLMLDHWEDHTYFSPALQSKLIDIKFNNKIDSCLKHSDISTYRGLLIVAHGSEQTEQSPLLKADGTNWELNLPQKLPAIVLIIACASQNNNFELLIKQCLAKGAETIIAPHGQLDAEQMLNFLSSYFKNHTISIAHHLYSKQKDNPQENGGINCLRLYGNLQPLASPVLEDYRQTNLEYYYRGHNVLNTLRQDHSIGHEADAQLWLTTTLDCLPVLPIATQVLLIDYCDYLAEQWATDKSRDIAKIRKKLQQTDCDYNAYESEFKSYVQAKTYRREGQYEQACYVCATLYDHLITEEDNTLFADFYGLLLNILIDLNLPNTAVQVSQLLDRCIRNDNSGQVIDRKDKQLDRQARLYMRQAKYILAIQNYRIKSERRESSSNRRELTTLLYAQAWTCPKNEEITSTINTVKRTISADDNNEFNKLKYEIRALALAAWRTKNKDNSLKILLKHYAPDIIKELEQDIDKGPAGMTFFFAYLAGIESYQDKSNFEKTIGALNHDSYWLELALLLSICGRTKEALQYLKNYHSMRQDSLDNLSQFWQANKIEINSELSRREQQESKLIKVFDQQYMLDNGLIPL